MGRFSIWERSQYHPLAFDRRGRAHKALKPTKIDVIITNFRLLDVNAEARST